MKVFFIVMQLVKLLELREANHIEFCRIKNVLDEVLHMYRNFELREILKLLMDPTWVATGLKVDFQTLVSSIKLSICGYSCLLICMTMLLEETWCSLHI